MNLTGQSTTFIPKKPTVSIDPERRSVGFFSLISLIIFIGTLVAAGGAYFYKYTLEKDIVQLSNELKEQEDKFDPNFIKVMNRFNARIEGAKAILNRHIAVSPVFEALSRATLQSVQLQSFSFNSSNVGGKPSVRVNIKGVAAPQGRESAYGSLAAQADRMNKDKYIKQPVFSSFNLNEQGRVTFTLDANVDSRLIDYRERVRGNLFKDNGLESDLESSIETPPASSATSTPSNSSTSTPNRLPQ